MSAAEPSPLSPVAYLGPDGSFSHLLARRHCAGAELHPFATVPEVFQFVRKTPGAIGVVPIENSSGGAIIPTIDGLIEHAGAIFVQEELLLDVKLALLGRAGVVPEVVYSHFAPLQHSEQWLRRTYPEARRVASSSTSGAVQQVLNEPRAAAIGPRENAALHGLDVLHFPIEEGVPNLTQFYVISHTHRADAECEKSAFLVSLPNVPGSLYGFLGPFHRHGVNLTRIQSRPIFGRPNAHLFFVELAARESDPAVAAALDDAGKVADRIDRLGSFPSHLRYQS